MAKHKKYHQSHKDRMHESNAMKHSGSEDHMIMNDNSEIANMPQGVKMRPYPYPSMMDENYNDGISGIDKQMSEDHGKLRSQYKPRKF